MIETIFDAKGSSLSAISRLDNRGIHGLSLGCLDAYFHLNEDLREGFVTLLNGRILFLRKRKKVFVYERREEDTGLLKQLQREASVYSIYPFLGLQKGGKFVEIAYDLAEVFNPKFYSCKKKRYNRIVYPFRWLDKNRVRVSSDIDLKEVKKLHSEWVQYKLRDSKTFKIMFPTRRYLRCFERSVSGAGLIPIRYVRYGFFLDGQLVSVRVLSIQGKYAYDLANFTNTWGAPSQLSNYADIFALEDLYINKGAEVVNCGAKMNKYLGVFKGHLPHQEVISYMYSRIGK